MSKEIDVTEVRIREHAYRRGAHQAAAKAYQIACQAKEEGKSADQIIEAIGRFEDQLADWRDEKTNLQPL